MCCQDRPVLPIGNIVDPTVVLPKSLFIPKGDVDVQLKLVVSVCWNAADSNITVPKAVFLGSVILLGRLTFMICSLPELLMKLQVANEGVQASTVITMMSLLNIKRRSCALLTCILDYIFPSPICRSDRSLCYRDKSDFFRERLSASLMRSITITLWFTVNGKVDRL